MTEIATVATGRKRHQEKLVLNRRLYYSIRMVDPGFPDLEEFVQRVSDIMSCEITPSDAKEAMTLGEMAAVLQAWKDRGIGRSSVEYVLDKVFWEGD